MYRFLFAHHRTPRKLVLRLAILTLIVVLVAGLFTTAQPAAADSVVVATVGVGINPYSVGVNAATNRIYVVNQNSDSVSVINGTTNSVLTTIGVGDGPFGVAVNATTNRIYVANGNSDTVSVIDGSSNTLLATVAVVGNAPEGVAVNASTNRIYVANFFSDNISVIDGSSNTLLNTVAVGNAPVGVAVNETTNRIYVVNQNSDSVSVIDGSSNTILTTVSVGDNPQGVGVNATTNRIYVTNALNDNVSVIDGTINSVIAIVGVGDSPFSVGVNESKNRIYIANAGNDTVSVIDGATNTLIATVSVGDNPQGVGVNATTNRIYVANRSSHTVSVIGEPVYSSVPASGSIINVGYGAVSTIVTNASALTVSNTGSSTLNITGMSITGINASEFSVSPSPNFTINTGDQGVGLSIQCTPGGLGVRLATLTIPHNDYGADATYTLACSGQTPLPTATPTNTPTALPTNTPISLLPTNTIQPRSRTPVPLFNGLRGFYFDNPNFTSLVLSRLDTTVDFNWLTGSPDASIGADTFSVRWTGMVVPQYSQPYRFYVEADGGVRLWVNNVKIIDNWVDANTTRTSTAITLAAGQYYRIQLEYYENTGNAKAILSWSSTSQTRQIIPSARLFTR